MQITRIPCVTAGGCITGNAHSIGGAAPGKDAQLVRIAHNGLQAVSSRIVTAAGKAHVLREPTAVLMPADVGDLSHSVRQCPSADFATQSPRAKRTLML